MRTRIALAAATTAAVTIAISTAALVGNASGAPSRVTRPTHRARPARAATSGRDATSAPGSGPDALAATTSASATYVPSGFLAPTLSVVHRQDVAHEGRRDSPSLATMGRIAEVRDIQMGRVVAAWRAAHPVPVAKPPAPAPAPVVLTDSNSTTTPDWACIRLHESGDRFNTPAAPGGAYGFLEGTWLSLGYGGWPYQASPAVQGQAALYLYNELGWQPWSTRVVCGL